MLTGIVLLFLGSLYIGHQIISPYERSLDETINANDADQSSPATNEAAKKRARFRKARLALSSFDLVAGFTNQELEVIPTHSRTFSFIFMLACFWLILGLRKPKRD